MITRIRRPLPPRWAAVSSATAAALAIMAGVSAQAAAGPPHPGNAAARAASLGAGSAGTRGGAASAGTRPVVRVNQVGFPTRSLKVAFAMLPRKVRGVSFTVSGAHGPVFHGRSTADLGRWSARYPAVYKLDFSGLARPGIYRVKVTSAAGAAMSPPVRIARPAALYGRLVLNAVRYFTSERDGAGVVRSVLHRRPANLTDRRAWVYAHPRYDSNDNLLGKFRRIGGPVNVAGGWFDAGGGYEKFAYTGSYTDGILLTAARDARGRYPALGKEAAFGLHWLEKLWRPARKVLYIQAGIGNGNASNTIQGDYNFWFLPQREDRLNVKAGHKPGPSAYYVKYRPVFEASRPGRPISPDFAGRFAAGFALGAQLAARGRPAAARRLLARARGVYAMAKTRHVGQLLTTFPHDYYPGTQWKSDMLWGAAEIALADEALGSPSARLRADLHRAARWARAYLAQGHPAGSDTLNLYDTGAVAEADLLQAMREAHTQPVPARLLLGDLAAQLRVGERWSHRDRFGLGTPLGSSDVSPHAFGLYITNALYQRYGGPGGFSGFAQRQLGYPLGANPWGSSFVAGAGTVFPHCMQSEIANLAGSLTGKGEIQAGATTDGPSARGNFVGLGTVSGMRPCHYGHYRPFDTRAVGYEDNVVSWPSVEPAGDYTAASLFAFVLAAQQRTWLTRHGGPSFAGATGRPRLRGR
jgi:endoglucanase